MGAEHRRFCSYDSDSVSVYAFAERKLVHPVIFEGGSSEAAVFFGCEPGIALNCAAVIVFKSLPVYKKSGTQVETEPDDQ